MKRMLISVVMAAMIVFCAFGCARKSSDPTEMPSGRPSHGVNNDSFEGGGAGGTEDGYESTRPDAAPDTTDGGVMDELEDGINDMIDGAGDAIRDAGDALREGARSARDSMK